MRLPALRLDLAGVTGASLKDLGHISDSDIDKITHLNAIRVFHFDLFATRPRDKCTVQALRAEPDDVYTGYHHAPKRGSLPAMAAALRDRMGKV